MVRTITFFSDIERDTAFDIALAQNVNADIGVQGLKTAYVSNGQRKCRTGDVECFRGADSGTFGSDSVQQKVWRIENICRLCFLRLQRPSYWLANVGFRGTCCHIVGEISFKTRMKLVILSITNPLPRLFQ